MDAQRDERPVSPPSLLGPRRGGGGGEMELPQQMSPKRGPWSGMASFLRELVRDGSAPGAPRA